MLWLIGASVAGVWWAASQSSETAEIRSWQVRQDARIESLEETQTEVITQNARIEELLQVMKTQ